eukprot:Seg1585.6 transcript_id=Seg1585.6/GoldUCD/mRNA.D3Y31 product="hypothetical protein" protein_id=Seg1585.6/GoldUCD/D3Y31
MTSRRNRAGRRITDDYDFDELHYYGDQSWQDFQNIGSYYNSEFQPEDSRRNNSKNRWSIRSKIASIRRSFFNVAHEPDPKFKVTTTKEEPKRNVKEKLSEWRKSLLGDKSPGPIRKLSAVEARQKAMDPDPAHGLSKGGKNRLNVTKKFVTKHAEPEAVYKKPSKSPTTPKRISFLDQVRPTSPIEVQAVITPPPSVAVTPPRSPPPTTSIVMEEVIIADEKSHITHNKSNSKAMLSEYLNEIFSKMKAERLKSALQKLRDGERHSKLRNESLLKDFDKVTKMGSDLDIRAEKLKKVKLMYLAAAL